MVAALEGIPGTEPNFILQARQRARVDPVWFAREVLQLKRLPGEASLADDPHLSWELDLWTIELLEAVADVVRHQEGIPTKFNHEGLNQISIRSMHGPGKTFGLALLMHWFGFCFLGKNPCTAPKIGQLKRRLWPEFRKIRRRSLIGYSSLQEVQSEAIYWMGADGHPDPDHVSFMETASSPESLAGLHDRYMLICVDEASGIAESLWPVIEGAISTGKIVILVIISNPTKMQGTFAASHLRANVAKNWYRMHISLNKTNRVSRDWVTKMEEKYGKDSPVVRIRCYGDFAEEDQNQLIAMQWIDDAKSKDFATDGSLPTHRLSVDCADGGGNFSVVSLASHYESFTHWRKQWQHNYPTGKAVTMLAHEVERQWRLNELNKMNGDDIVVDSLGVGAGVASILIEKGYPVVLYKGGAKSDNTELWRCRRVQSYLVKRNYLRDGKVIIDDDFVDEDEWDDLYGQLCSIQIRHGTERLEDLMTKEQMVNQGIVSPDRADSLAMQYATQAPEMSVGDLADYFTGQNTETANYDGSIAESF